MASNFEKAHEATRAAMGADYRVARPQDQAEHDQMYSRAVSEHLHGTDKTWHTIGDDRKICEKLIERGADMRHLKESVARHSPNLQGKHPSVQREIAEKIVTAGAYDYLANQAMEPKQNVKPGHEQHRDPNPKRPTGTQREPEKSQQHDMAHMQWVHQQGMTR